MTNTLTVARSLDRIVQIGGKKYRLFAEDWLNAYQAEEAASACAITLNKLAAQDDDHDTDDISFECNLPLVGAMLASLARDKLGVDDARPFGFAIVVEPCDNVSHSG